MPNGTLRYIVHEQADGKPLDSQDISNTDTGELSIYVYILKPV